MSFRSSLALLKVPFFAPALLASLFTILAEAVGGSYMALFAVQKVGMSPLELSAFLTLSAISGIGVAAWFGHLHDRRPALWPLYLTLAAKIIGFALCCVLTTPWMLIAVAFFLFGLSSASFLLLFSIAKGYLDLAGGDAPARGMASLRMISSLGWAIGPALGALLVGLSSFAGVYLGAALLGFIALGTVIVSRIAPQPVSATEPAKITLDVLRAAAPAAFALAVFHTAMFMGSTAMSITVVQGLGSETDVGLLFSLCALLEVFVMGAFVVQPRWTESRAVLVAGFFIFAAYFALLLFWPTLPGLYFGQILRATGIGIISVLGMSVLQTMLPGRTGVAAALFSNTMSAGALGSGLGTGIFAEAFGYASIFAVCGVLLVLGGFALWPRRRQPL